MLQPSPLPILLAVNSVNHKLPSGPAVMPRGLLPAVGITYSVKIPAGVTFPILFVVGAGLGEPQVAVGTGGDAERGAAGCRDEELGDGHRCGLSGDRCNDTDDSDRRADTRTD
jgi:hypothetical protein